MRAVARQDDKLLVGLFVDTSTILVIIGLLFKTNY